MAYRFENEEKLIVELTNGDVIEGEFVASSCSRLDLNKCLDKYTNEKIPGIQHFYESEIVDVKSFQTHANGSSSTTSDENAKTNQASDTSSAITISEDKYNQLKLLAKKYIYMATMDARYNEAVNYLANCETIGVALLGTDWGRASVIDLFVISSWDQIYVFDISLYNCKHFPAPLKYLLECDDITKAVHDSRGLVDCMHHRYNIKVNNIFDTHVASKIICGEDLQLYQCLSRYFNFPEVLIKEAMNPSLKSQWNKRPLDDDTKKFAAMNVQYLITLKNYLEKQLLKDFHHTVLKHSQSTLVSSPLEAQLAIGSLNIN